MCVAVSDNSVTSNLYSELLEVALNSAKKNTTLNINVLYDGPDDHVYMKIMRKYNVNIIRWKFSRFSYLEKTFSCDYLKENFNMDVVDYKKISGTFMRFDIPYIEKDDDYVLYTDIDVFFNKDITLDSFKLTKVIAAGPETEKNFTNDSIYNAGILLFNVKEMRNQVDKIFLQLEKGVIPKVSLFDQGYLNEVCRSDIELFPLEFNWKPYWGYNSDAYIVHFHGIKPGGDNNASGFNMSDAFFYHVFNSQNEDVIFGYLMYFKDYFYYLEKNNDKWIKEHAKKILKLVFPDSKSVRRRIYCKMMFNIFYKNLFLSFTGKY